MLGMMNDVNPFDGPPTTPPVSFEPPPVPRRRGRMVGVVLATTGLLGAGVFGVSALVSADDDPALGSAPTTTGDDGDADDTTTTTAPDEPGGDEQSSTEDGPTVRIDDGEGAPFVIDLGELDAEDLREFTECAGLPMLGGDVFGEFEIFGDLPSDGDLGPKLDELLQEWLRESDTDASGELPSGDELGPMLDELLGEWLNELDEGSADGSSGDELGPLLDQLLGDLAADGELGAWLDQLLQEARESQGSQGSPDGSAETGPTDDELGALLDELLGGLGGLGGPGDDGALADRLEELLGDGELGGWFGGPGHPGGPHHGPMWEQGPGRGRMHLGEDGTVTVLGPDGPAWIDLGDGDGSVTITRDGETGELTITTDGTAEEVDIDDLVADLPPIGPDGPIELPDPDQLQDCLDQLDDD